MDSGIRRLLLFQSSLIAATAVVFLVIFETISAVSVCYGGGMVAANALLLRRCAHRDARATERSPQQSLAAVYLCVVQRFLVIALLFALGLGLLKLKPLALLSGFIAGQLVMVVMETQRLKKN
ncbi:MAG: ATP synthase subunit I [Pseudomonadota bacterium]|nr:ATP synthase subunit I [Pseudomonadota bacterium]